MREPQAPGVTSLKHAEEPGYAVRLHLRGCFLSLRLTEQTPRNRCSTVPRSSAGFAAARPRPSPRQGCGPPQARPGPARPRISPRCAGAGAGSPTARPPSRAAPPRPPAAPRPGPVALQPAAEAGLKARRHFGRQGSPPGGLPREGAAACRPLAAILTGRARRAGRGRRRRRRRARRRPPPASSTATPHASTSIAAPRTARATARAAAYRRRRPRPPRPFPRPAPRRAPSAGTAAQPHSNGSSARRLQVTRPPPPPPQGLRGRVGREGPRGPWLPGRPLTLPTPCAPSERPPPPARPPHPTPPPSALAGAGPPVASAACRVPAAVAAPLRGAGPAGPARRGRGPSPPASKNPLRKPRGHQPSSEYERTPSLWGLPGPASPPQPGPLPPEPSAVVPPVFGRGLFPRRPRRCRRSSRRRRPAFLRGRCT